VSTPSHDVTAAVETPLRGERNAGIQHSLNGLRAPALCAVSNPSESSALPSGSRTSRRHRWTTQRSVLDTGHLVQETTQKGRLRLAARHSSRGGAVRRMMIMSRLLFLRADRLCDTCRSGTAPSRSWSFPNACAAPVADAQPSDHSPPRSMRTSASADTDMPDPCHDAREFTVTGDSSTRARRQLQRNDDRRTDSTLC
jgi:hypothetical protein